MRKNSATKDWYWEAEQDKIAADQDLKLIRSPDGWPSEGLDCVGLWFLMFNLMARSTRKGYLLSPADHRKPMSSHELAVLTGRAEAVVSRIQAVILQRGLFSQTEEGIIYSRGLVRKEELRRKRSKSGKKGGMRTQDLLKQMLEQKLKQSLSIGINNTSEINNHEGEFAQAKVEANSAAERLAFVYRSHIRGRRPEEIPICIEAFAEMLEMGLTEQVIMAELKLKPPKRDRSEQLWQIKARLFERAGICGKKGKDLFGGISEFVGGCNGKNEPS